MMRGLLGSTALAAVGLLAIEPAAADGVTLKIGGRYKVDLSSADDLLSGAEDADSWGEETAEGFRLLEKVMRATLSDLSVAFARGNNAVRVRMWLFGRSEDGSLVGLRSMSTET
jgi:hypothetical protein